MDVWLPAVGAVAAAIAIAATVWLRKRRIEQAQHAMREAHFVIQKIQADLQPHSPGPCRPYPRPQPNQSPAGGSHRGLQKEWSPCGEPGAGRAGSSHLVRA